MALVAQRDLRALDRSLRVDGSILTQTERCVEVCFKQQIRNCYPGANLLGEHRGAAGACAQRVRLCSRRVRNDVFPGSICFASHPTSVKNMERMK